MLSSTRRATEPSAGERPATVLPTAEPWLGGVGTRPGSSLRLFCFPYAGGGASAYRAWADEVPPEIEVCPVQLPGRENRLRAAPFVRMLPLIQALAEALGPCLDRPFAFFGHSMGALISFELARYLRKHGYPGPLCLLPSAHRAPQLPDPDPPIHQLPDSELLTKVRRLNGTHEEVLRNAELRQIVLPVLRADLAICETYVYSAEEPLDCPIYVFGGLRDREVTRDELAAWRMQTQDSFRVCMLPGDHFFLHSARNLLTQAMSGHLLQLLTEATPR